MSWLASILQMLSKSVIPPDENDKPSMFWYRVRVVVVACTAFMLWPVAIPMAMGVWPAVFPGFARATEVKSIATEVRSYRGNQIEQDIFTLRISQCKSTSDQLRQQYEARIRWLMQEYYRLTAQVYTESSCENL